MVASVGFTLRMVAHLPLGNNWAIGCVAGIDFLFVLIDSSLHA